MVCSMSQDPRVAEQDVPRHIMEPIASFHPNTITSAWCCRVTCMERIMGTETSLENGWILGGSYPHEMELVMLRTRVYNFCSQ